ncbi:class I adenylate-forming enzyme family protein [Gordonia humi]|uniref:Acyl-CoA synthetase (AMP-forming)/AMP-acid ligase II n=1 Tax=Gordonia humi TaxID=686429 RepID=A0A840F0H2_9ACTN|nr:AMP-binding protein [Gordonia humi]MBB4133860.1 acyl-CoA synthetase (AMP-forming)/AMP-acid ligase II [Gordonia humi]
MTAAAARMPTTLGDAVEEAVRAHPDASVTIVSDERPAIVSLGGVGREARVVAAWLQSIGVGRGDVVALQLPNWSEGIVLQAAAILVGATIVPIVPNYGPRELSFILRDSGAKVVALTSSFLGRRRPVTAAEIDALAEVETVVVLGDDVPDEAVSWADAHADEAAFVAPDRDPDDCALLVYTSGTTGSPKGVRHTHRSLLADTFSPVVAGNAGPGTCHLAVFPPGHMAGVNGLLRILVLATPTVLMDRWDAERAAGLVDEHAVTATGGAPVHLADFLDARDRGSVSLRTLRDYLVGGATVPEALIARADAAGIVAYRAYGSSEHPTVSAGSTADPIDKRAGTDGRVQPGNRVRIVDDAGLDLPVGVDGDILTSGDELFAGYRDGSLDDAAFDAGWFRTGDVGHLDAEGYLTITDRKKDIIVRGGENIASREVEDVLGAHPRVADVAVIAAPDPRLGETVAAFVVLRDGDLTPTEAADFFVAHGVARQKAPTVIRVVAELPRTALGKVEKSALRARLHLP